DSGFKEIYQGDMSSHSFSKNSFDVVRYSHVLEHVLSPKKELQRVRGFLKKGGKVLIIVPNIDSIFFKIFKGYWYPLEAPRHFYQFSPKTLTRLLLESGFHNIKIKYSQPPHTFLWSVFYWLGLHKSDIRFGYLVVPLTLALKFSVFLKKSDVIEVVAKKN
ncbi:MAG: class I SAM-dependent methyltransferase, partial [Nanoarchaeota archaeon]